MKDKINFEKFIELSDQLEIKMGTIISVEPVPKSDKMLKLEVGFGDDDVRIVMTNIGDKLPYGDGDELLGNHLPFITNLEPAKIMGIMSEAMIMVGENLDGQLEFGKHEFTNGTKLM